MTYGIILKVDGNYEVKEPENGTDFQLAELKDCIGGGYIEIVPVTGALIVPDSEENLQGDLLLICDEDGQRKELPLNPAATAFCDPLFRRHILGDVLICPRSAIT